MKLFSALAATTLFVGSLANASTEFASEADQKNYYTIDSIEIVPVETDAKILEKLNVIYSSFRPLPQAPTTVPTDPVPQVPQIPQMPPAPQAPQAPGTGRPVTLPQIGLPGSGGGITDPMTIQQWITVGERVWQLVANNRPTASVSTHRVSVLPASQEDWAQIEGWQGPAARTFEVVARNILGSTVVRNKYTIAWNYGGKYNGKGAYIGNLTMIPTDISVSFGYTLNSRVVVGDAVNIASTNDPVPALNFQVEYSVTNVFKHIQSAESFFVTGKGGFKKIN